MDNKETMLGRLMSVLVSVPASMLGTLVDLVRKLSGDNGDQTHRILKKMLRGELCESGQKWREKDGVIYLPLLTSDGTTGPKWIKRLEKKNFQISNYAKDILRSDDFKPTNGVTYEIAILKGMLFEDDDRITKKIRAEADNRKLTKPNAEVACLIRENFSDEEIEDMGLYWIIIMHEPIKDAVGDPGLLRARRSGDGRWLDTDWGKPGLRWDRDDGFAFVVSQVSF